MPVIQLMLSSPPLLMVQKLNGKSTKDPNSTPLDSTVPQTSILVFLSARVIGSLGFAVSLLAIWFGWLLPASLPASLTTSDTSEIKKPRPSLKHHRRAVSWASTAVRRSSAPVDLAPILVPHVGENSSRRVSFAAFPSTPAVRQNTLPEPRNSLVSTISPPHSRPGTLPNGFDSLNAHDSDSSLSRPSRLQKLKRGFNLKIRQVSADKQSDRDSITSIESTVSENVTKQSNSGFVAAWSNSRAHTAGDDMKQGSASPSRSSFVRLLLPSTPTTFVSRRAEIQSPTFLSNKAERRRSTPIPRTYPYGAPYFASPPALLDKKTYPSYLKTLPQFEDEVQVSSARATLSERRREPVTGRLRNPSRWVIPKRRSASEDWTVRPPTNS